MASLKYLLIFDVVSGVSLILFFLFKPKSINSFYGYRTPRSIKNQRNWDFAQTYSSKLFLSVPAVLLLTQLPLILESHNERMINTITIISISEFTLLSVVIIFLTENQLKKLDSNSDV